MDNIAAVLIILASVQVIYASTCNGPSLLQNDKNDPSMTLSMTETCACLNYKEGKPVNKVINMLTENEIEIEFDPVTLKPSMKIKPKLCEILGFVESGSDNSPFNEIDKKPMNSNSMPPNDSPEIHNYDSKTTTSTSMPPNYSTETPNYQAKTATSISMPPNDSTETLNYQTKTATSTSMPPDYSTETPNYQTKTASSSSMPPNYSTETPNYQTKTATSTSMPPNYSTGTPNHQAKVATSTSMPPTDSTETLNFQTKTASSTSMPPNYSTETPNYQTKTATSTSMPPNGSTQTPRNEVNTSTDTNEISLLNAAETKKTTSKTSDHVTADSVQKEKTNSGPSSWKIFWIILISFLGGIVFAYVLKLMYDHYKSRSYVVGSSGQQQEMISQP